MLGVTVLMWTVAVPVQETTAAMSAVLVPVWSFADVWELKGAFGPV